MGKGRLVRALLMGLLLWLGPTAAGAETPPVDLLAFRDRVAAEIRRIKPDAKIILLGRTGLRVVFPGDVARDQSLERAYSSYRLEPERLDEYVASYARSFLPIGVDAQALRVLVRTDASNPPTEAGVPDSRGLTRPIAGGLIAIVALDGPEAFEFPRAARLRAELKIGDAVIWSRAQANTRAAIPYPPRALEAGREVRLESGKGLSSSLLIDEAFWNSPVMKSQEPIVVALAERDLIFLMRAADKELVEGYRTALARQAEHVLFPKLLVRRDGRWEVLP